MTDRKLDIATGESRKTKQWKNKKMSWTDLVEQLRTPTVTQETVAEYKAMTKDKKAEIKDVGGFVAGYCEGGNRTKVKHRSCITLDADSVVSDIWADWIDCYGNAACLYSTHTHTPDAQRYRLIIPTDRNMSPDEYQAVSRRIADTLGMDNFDESTHQAQRLMYWPSCSRDAEYVFEVCDGDLLCVDTVLATYVDWHDMSAWPTNSGLPAEIKKKAEKQQDPLEKDGLVGAFCRAYNPIQEAIAAFVPEYEPCEGGRYTYLPGSAAAGVVIYDDRFAYSNHATDPASGQLLNAFDLVRVHKFGALDADAKENTPPASLPSWRAMVDFCNNDDRTKVQLYEDRQQNAVDVFDDLTDASETEDDKEWVTKLKHTQNGALAQTIENVCIILNNDPKLKGRIAYDEMGRREVAVDDLPWKKMPKGKPLRRWEDNDDANLRLYLEKEGLQGKDRIYDAVDTTAHRNCVHPVKQFIEEAAWDGVKRVETLLIDYLGAADTEYTRTVTRKALVAAVARIYNPGCKFDYILSLKGKQGIGKSSILKRLAGEWFSDSLVSMAGKEAFEQLCNVWIMEIGELASMKRSEIENVKNFLSAQEDKYRPAYARRVCEFPRQCIFVATTNEAYFLRDKTGNRRFWVVECNRPHPKTWDEITDEEVHQIWAEAKHYFDKGEKLYLNSKLEAVAREIQEQFTEEDPQIGVIEEYLERLLPADWAEMELDARRYWLNSTDKEKAPGVLKRTTVCAKEIFCEALGQNPDRATLQELRPINDTITNKFPEWTKKAKNNKRFPIYGRQRYYQLEGYGTEWVTEDDDFLK